MAEETRVPPEQQVSLLLKALFYDRNLEERGALQNKIYIAVVFKKGGDVSGIVDAFNKSKKVKGLYVEAVSVPFSSVAKLMEMVDTQFFNAIYVHSSAVFALSGIQQVTRGKKIPSLCGMEKLVEHGISLGLHGMNPSVKLMVNLKASRLEGLDLDSRFLSIAEVIR